MLRDVAWLNCHFLQKSICTVQVMSAFVMSLRSATAICGLVINRKPSPIFTKHAMCHQFSHTSYVHFVCLVSSYSRTTE